MDPLGERVAEQFMHVGHPVDVDDGLRGPTGFVRVGPRAIALGPASSDADDCGHRLRMFDRVADSQITTPGVTHHDPAADTGGLADAFQVGDRPFHRVRAPTGAAHAARLGVPGAVVGRRDVVSFQVLDATGSARQDDQVGPLAGHSDVQRDAVHLNRLRLHVSDASNGSPCRRT